jgi:ribosomal protein L23
MKHAVGSGLIGRGKDRYNCKLSESIVFDIRYNLSKTHSQRKIAKIFNVSLASINSVIKYKSWKHVQKDCQL